MSVFVIAEAGVNHNGDADRALAMVDAAREAGADAVKFQSFSADKVIGPTAEKAEYQKRETGEGSQRDMVRPLEMSEDLHHRLVERCEAQGIEFMSTPFDYDALEMLMRLKVRRMKAPSGEIANPDYLRRMAAKNLPMIVSTGMATLEEIQEAVALIAATRASLGFTAPMTEMVTILHCTSNYPAECADVNLRAMRTIADATGLPVGYSDHTLSLSVPTAAVALGATVIEKHFTLDNTLPGPDHRASLEPDQLAAMIRQIREVEVALGSPIKAPSEAELAVRAVARRSITATRNLPAGHVLTEDDMILLRPASGIAPKHLDEMAGRTLAQPVAEGTPFQWSHLA